MHELVVEDSTRAYAVNALLSERERQELIWGPQTHPDGTSPNWEYIANIKKQENDRKVESDPEAITWLDIFMEEVYEAMTETEPEKLKTELIQAAAVATAWVEDIDTRDGADS